MSSVTGMIPSHLMKSETDAPDKRVMGKDDFLKLLMAQLRQQDPLNPLKHEEFATQLAQFSSLEKLTTIDKGIESLHESQGSESRGQALSMIGREIEASGREVHLQEGQPLSLNIGGDENAHPVKASIFDRQGTLVREFDLSRRQADQTELSWDGKDQEGTALSSGSYNFRVFGVDAKGVSKELNTGISGKVVGVDMQGKDPILVVETATGKARVGFDKVSSVSLEGGKTPPSNTKSIPIQQPVKSVEPALRAATNPIPQETTLEAEPREIHGMNVVGRYLK